MTEAVHRAQWMEGQWGFRFLLPGNLPGQKEAIENFDVEAMMEQIRPLAQSAKWVQINATQGAKGTFYTTPVPILRDHVCRACVPKRDLFGEMIDALINEGFKVMVYFASEGPSGSCSRVPHFVNKWEELCEKEGMTSKEAVAKLIVKYISDKYGEKISGWWFDQGQHCDHELIAEAARSGNPDAVVTINFVEEHTFHDDGSLVLKRNTAQEDYTGGHPMPVVKKPPSWEGNASQIKDIEEKGPYFDDSLGHLFLPMQSKWYAGEVSFEKEKLISWTLRIIKAGGAITWASALVDQSLLPEAQLDLLKDLNDAVLEWRAQEMVDEAKDSVAEEL